MSDERLTYSNVYSQKKKALLAKKQKLYKQGDVSRWLITDTGFEYTPGMPFEEVEPVMLSEVLC